MTHYTSPSKLVRVSMYQTGFQTMQKFLHKQWGHAALCVVSEKFRAHRFWITSWYYRTEIMTTMIKTMKWSMCNKFTINIIISFWVKFPSGKFQITFHRHKHSSSTSIIFQFLLSILQDLQIVCFHLLLTVTVCLCEQSGNVFISTDIAPNYQTKLIKFWDH